MRISLLKYVLFLIGLSLSLPTFAQSIRDVRINEIQVFNTDGFRDEYGRASGWIELFNAGWGKVNVAGCTLEVRGAKYVIPRGNPATVVATRGYIVFFAGGTPEKGLFHTNFTLYDTDFIKLYDSDGKLIDSVQFNPSEMAEGISYGWFEDYDGVEKWGPLLATTPGASNHTIEKMARSEAFRQADPSGIVLTITNLVIVAIALTMLFFEFKYMGNYHVKLAKRKTEKIKVDQTEHTKAVAGKQIDVISNDALAAIAIALYKYSKELHDNEEMVLTINKVSKAYSPWSSKIYGLRQFPK